MPSRAWASKKSDPDAWAKTLASARGKTVRFAMWSGDPLINAWVDGWLAPKLRAERGVRLLRTPLADTADAVNKLIYEKKHTKPGSPPGTIDLLWVNGENFHALKQDGLLRGPFTQALPNFRAHYDPTSPQVSLDFGSPVDGFEAPYGLAQFVLVYDSARIPDPPRTLAALLQWARENPGKFTYPAPPDFTGSAFLRQALWELTQNPVGLATGRSSESAGTPSWPEPDPENWQTLWDFLKTLAPHLWQAGATYPASVTALHRLYSDGELWITLAYSPTAAEAAIRKRVFPASTRSFVLDSGSLSNTHFLAIPFNAPEPDAARVAIDFALSPAVQLSKLDPTTWGDFSALEVASLDAPTRAAFSGVQLGAATLDPRELALKAIPEPSPELVVALENGWKKRFLTPATETAPTQTRDEVTESIALTARLALLSTLLSCALGLALALGLAATARGSRLARALLHAPLGLPHFAVASAVAIGFSSSGLLARLLHALGAVAGTSDWPGLAHDRAGLGIILAYVLKETPFIAAVLLPLAKGALRRYGEAAAALGASRRVRAARISLPLLFPALFASGVLVFCFVFGDFEIPYLLGRSHPRALAVLAYESLTHLDLERRTQARELALLCSLLCVPVLLAYSALRARWRAAFLEADEPESDVVPPEEGTSLPAFSGAEVGPAPGRRLTHFLTLCGLLALLAPWAVLLAASVSDRWSWPALLPQALSLRAWAHWFTGPSRLTDPLLTTLGLGAGVALLGLAIALPLARAVSRFGERARFHAEALVFIPVAVPPFALAIGISEFFTLIEFNSSWAAVLLAHLVPSFPYLFQPLLAGFSALGENLEEQARALGATPAQAFCRITLPRLVPSIVTGLGLAFLVSSGQYLLTLLVGGGKVLTLPLAAVPLGFEADRATAASAGLLLAAPGVLLVVGNWLSYTKKGHAPREHDPERAQEIPGKSQREGR